VHSIGGLKSGIMIGGIFGIVGIVTSNTSKLSGSTTGVPGRSCSFHFDGVSRDACQIYATVTTGVIDRIPPDTSVPDVAR
jgi:hypothetical protein